MKDYILTLIKESFEKVLIVMGFLLLCGSFCQYSSITKFQITSSPNFFLFCSGWLLIIASFINIKIGKKRFKLKSTLKFCTKDLQLLIKYDKIENSNGGVETAIVLPANTMLDDECINDKRSALGAFILTNLPDKKELFNNQIKTIRETFSDNLTCEPGSTFILDKKYNLPYDIILTCVTEKSQGFGVHSSILNVIKCVESVFKVASDNKINRIVMPVIGSGHGGIDINISIQLMLLSSIYFSKHFHHIKNIEIIIHEKDKARVNNDFNYLSKFNL